MKCFRSKQKCRNHWRGGSLLILFSKVTCIERCENPVESKGYFAHAGLSGPCHCRSLQPLGAPQRIANTTVTQSLEWRRALRHGEFGLKPRIRVLHNGRAICVLSVTMQGTCICRDFERAAFVAAARPTAIFGYTACHNRRNGARLA